MPQCFFRARVLVISPVVYTTGCLFSIEAVSLYWLLIMRSSDTFVNLRSSDVLSPPRYASLERYLAFLVMFHAMAARVANWFPLNFDLARSQSQLRVATTAAPISAAELEKEWAHDASAVVFHPTREVMPDATLHHHNGGPVNGSATASVVTAAAPFKAV